MALAVDSLERRGDISGIMHVHSIAPGWEREWRKNGYPLRIA